MCFFAGLAALKQDRKNPLSHKKMMVKSDLQKPSALSIC